MRFSIYIKFRTYPARLQIILNAMKKYGLILADMGCNMYSSLAPCHIWNTDKLQQWAKSEAPHLK